MSFRRKADLGDWAHCMPLVAKALANAWHQPTNTFLVVSKPCLPQPRNSVLPDAETFGGMDLLAERGAPLATLVFLGVDVGDLKSKMSSRQSRRAEIRQGGFLSEFTTALTPN